ncbi:hypothetical protein GOBAR_DD09379 [Gossypium barbadense]|nr:hypothetical protein GOBAR_DD09379 [Gossypium barbadense]
MESAENFLNSFAFASQKVAILVDDGNFLAWKQHVLLMIKTHRLQSFADVTIAIPPRVVVDDEGVSSENPTFIQYEHGCGQSMPLEEQQSAILNGLPSEFDHVVLIITTSRIPIDLQANLNVSNKSKSSAAIVSSYAGQPPLQMFRSFCALGFSRPGHGRGQHGGGARP